MKPKLSRSLALDEFQSHYWLKAELVAFCKENGLSALGLKEVIAHRIAVFLGTGSKLKPKRVKAARDRDSLRMITRETLVVTYKNDAKTRVFFVSQIGKHFHFDHYLRQFTDKNNITNGLTYGDLVDGWLAEERKRKDPNYQSKIGEQFEYNKFTRDFFQNEKGKSRLEAINAWKLVKSIPGEKTYRRYREVFLAKK